MSMLGGPQTFTDRITAEHAAVTAGTATGCGQTCDDGCHGPMVCVRTEHPHRPEGEPHPETGEPQPADIVVHAGYDADGQTVQWTCLPGDHDGLTCEERATRRAEAEAATKTETAKALLANVDPALLVHLLRDGGHL